MSFWPSEALGGQALKTPHPPGGKAGPSMQGFADAAAHRPRGVEAAGTGASAVTRICRGALLREEGARQGQRAPSLGSSLRCFQQLLPVPLHRNGRRGEAESGWRRGAPAAGAVASGPPPPGGAELPWPPGRLLSWRWSCQS